MICNEKEIGEIIGNKRNHETENFMIQRKYK